MSLSKSSVGVSGLLEDPHVHGRDVDGVTVLHDVRPRRLRHPKRRRLDPLDGVRVVAQDPSHGRLPDFLQLFGSELSGLALSIVVEEPVSVLEPGELVADDAFEGGAEDGIAVLDLHEAAHVQVDVVHVAVDGLEFLNVRS